MDLVLIRHPAVATPAGVCYGRTDVPLADEAPASSMALAKRLDALGVAAPERIETSPRSRCRQVAQPIAALHGLVLHEDARLAEMDFGDWEMQPWDAIARAQIDAWAADFLHAREHGGESVAQFDARVGTWFDACGDAPALTVWAFTHAGVMRAIVARALALPLEQCVRWPLELAGIAWLRRTKPGKPWLLARWNV